MRASRESVYRAVWRWHFYAGLLCLPFLITLSATGSLYLFKEEINGSLFAYRTLVLVRETPPLGPDRVIFNAMQAVPDAAPVSYTDPATPETAALVTLAAGARKILVYLDSYTGTVLDPVVRDQEIMVVLRGLHSHAYLGPVANGVIEVAAGFAIILVLTGAYLWWPRGQDGGVISLRGTMRRRVWWRDFHAVTGFLAGGPPLPGAHRAALVDLAEPATARLVERSGPWPAALWANLPGSTVPLRGRLTDPGWTLEDAPVPRTELGAETLGIDRAAAILAERGMPRGYELALPVGSNGVYAASVYPRDVTRQRVIALDQYTGAPLLDVCFADLGPVGRAIQYGIGIHKGQHWGLLRRGTLALLLLGSPIAALGETSVTLDELSVEGEAKRAAGRARASDLGVAAPPGSAPSVIEHPVGEVVSDIGRGNTIADRPATTIGSVLVNSPGVTVRQGNGGRDVIIAIRGNSARSTGVIKTTVVPEDGFILTQPDGAWRYDLTDPHVYSRVDVFRWPQSPLFGNYATGGAIAFRTRTGREIDGYEIGVDAGSFGYPGKHFTVGGVSGPVEISLFACNVRANSYQDHSAYDTQTINLPASYTPTPDNRFTLKVINNTLDTNLAARSSLAQYRINPYQRGCAAAASAAPGCTTFALIRHGAFGAQVPVTADEGGFGRNDRRTMVAARWEHDLDAFTTWRTQPGFDERNFDQPVFTNAYRSSLPSLNVLTDLTRRGDLFGLPATGYVALCYKELDYHTTTFNLAPYGGPRPTARGADRRSAGGSVQSRRPGAPRPRPVRTLHRRARLQRRDHADHPPQPRLQHDGERHHPDRSGSE